MDRGSQLIQKYINEGLSDAERFELEKIALDDDFVADAWEGLVYSDVSNAPDIINRLEKRINKKEEARVIPLTQKLWPYAMAASFVLLAAFIFLFNSGEAEEFSTPETAIVMEDTDLDNPESTPHTIDESTKTDIIENTESFAHRAPKTTSDNEKMAVSRPAESTKELSENIAEAVEVVGLEDVAQEPPIIEEETVSIVSATVNESSPTSLTESRQADEGPSATTAENQAELKEDATTSIAKAAPLNAETLKDEVRGEEKSVAGLSLKAKKSNESPNLAKAFSRKADDQNNFPQPKIGFNEYRSEILKRTTITKEDLFMFNMKPGLDVQSQFKTDKDGNPNQVVIMNVPDGTIKEKLVDLLKTSGPWININDEWTFYNFKMPVMD